MDHSKPFILKKLDNGIKLFLVQDHLLDHDLVIKFKNYGAVIDHHFNVMGFQHLLEHCFFFQNDDYNLCTNAATSFGDMNLELSFTNKKASPNNSVLLLLKKWLFKNNDYSKLDFSRHLTIEEIRKYINELDYEAIYRDLLWAHWPLQNFFVSNKEYHYYGGNKKTFFNKEKAIQSFLKSPLPVPIEDIFIFLRLSAYSFYPEMNKLFGRLKPIERPNLSFSYNKENFFNKVIQINRNDASDLIFIFNKDEIELIDLLKATLLFPNFGFLENYYLTEYYLSFTFNKINDLCQMVLALETNPLLFLHPFLTDEAISDGILYAMMYESIPSSLLSYFSYHEVMTRTQFYKKEMEFVTKFLNLLHRAVKRKEYVINTKIDNFYKFQTCVNEPYNIFDINFNFNNFFHSSLITNVDSWLLQKEIKCNRSKEVTIVDLKKQTITNDTFHFIGKMPHDHKPTIYSYFEALTMYFVIPSFADLNAVISLFKSSKQPVLLQGQYKSTIVLTNKTYEIKTEYGFVFICFQISKSHHSSLTDYKTNLIHRLKKMGLLYHLEMHAVLFEKKTLLFFYTSSSKEGMDPIINFIKSYFISNNVNFTFNVIKSERSFFNDLSSVKKSIKLTY